MLRIIICSTLLMIFTQRTYGQLSKADPPTPANVEGYEKAHCVSLPPAIRVCKGLAESDNAFVLEKDGKRTGSWPGIASLGETSDFEVLQGDLDNDGQRELIVANHDTTSVGIAVNVWTISIFSAAEISNFHTPLTFSVVEYGPFGTFVSQDRRINVLSTRWQWARDPKRRRGTGLYLLGQWWRYSRGELLPSTNRSILARRFLDSFATERDQTSDTPTIPFKWLTGPSVETFRSDPILSLKEESVKEGLITNVSSGIKEERTTLTIEFKPDGGAPITLIYPKDDADEANRLTEIGEASANRLYPSRYIPTSPERWLKDRRATVITYGESEHRILWLRSK